MRSGSAPRYGLRAIALGYLLLLLALPFGAIVYYTFQDGVRPVLDALTDESFIAALKLTLIAVLIPSSTMSATNSSTTETAAAPSMLSLSICLNA